MVSGSSVTLAVACVVAGALSTGSASAHGSRAVAPNSRALAADEAASPVPEPFVVSFRVTTSPRRKAYLTVKSVSVRPTGGFSSTETTIGLCSWCLKRLDLFWTQHGSLYNVGLFNNYPGVRLSTRFAFLAPVILNSAAEFTVAVEAWSSQPCAEASSRLGEVPSGCTVVNREKVYSVRLTHGHVALSTVKREVCGKFTAGEAQVTNVPCPA